MIASVRAELTRLFRWPVTWLLCGIWLVLNLTFGYLFNYLAYRSDDGGGFGNRVAEGGAAGLLARMLPEQVPTTMIAGLPMFGGALMLILGAVSVGSGYGWGTWKTVFTTGAGRLTAVAGTLIALATVLIGLVIVTLGIDLLAGSAVAAAESQPATLPGLGDIARGLGAALLICGMWLSAGVLLGTLTRSPALAVGLGLVWSLVVENLLAGVSGLLDALAVVSDVLPGTAAGSLAGALGAAAQGEPNGVPGVTTTLTGGPAAGLLLGYAAVFLVISLVVTARRDLAG